MLYVMESMSFVVMFLLVMGCSATCDGNPQDCMPDCYKHLGELKNDQSQKCLNLGLPIIQEMSTKMHKFYDRTTDDPTPNELAAFNRKMYAIFCSDQGKRAIQCILDIASSTCPEAFAYAKSLPNYATSPAMDTVYILHFGSVDAICSGHEHSYADEVRDLLNRLQIDFPITRNCIAHANSTRNRFVGKYNEDKQYAILLINLYTQECMFSSSEALYRKINGVLRSGNSEQPWTQAGDLIDRGIDILGQEEMSVVYRGCHTPVKFTPGTEYKFSQIISTSLDPTVALLFGCLNGYTNSQLDNFVNTFFEIRKARGVQIDEYSAINAEQEFLLKSVNTFFVVNTTDDFHVIKKKIDAIVTHGHKIYPAVYVTLDMVWKSDDTSAATCFVSTPLIFLFGLFFLYVSAIFERLY